jgi:hypothetical protein
MEAMRLPDLNGRLYRQREGSPKLPKPHLMGSRVKPARRNEKGRSTKIAATAIGASAAVIYLAAWMR